MVSIAEETSEANCQNLGEHLEHQLAGLFLKIQTLLHIPEKICSGYLSANSVSSVATFVQ